MPKANEFGQLIGDSLPEGWNIPSAPPKEALMGHYVKVEPLEVRRHAADLFSSNQLDRAGEGWTYLGYGPFKSLLDYTRWLETNCVGNDPMFWAYLDGKTGVAVGLGAYLRVNVNDATIEVGHLRFSPKMQRTRIATEAMYLKMKLAFDLGYRRYEWKCDSLNLPSRKAAERLGFKFEGVFRQATHYRGRNRDTAWFSIIDKEWSTIRAAYEAWLKPSNFDELERQKKRLCDFQTIKQ